MFKMLLFLIDLTIGIVLVKAAPRLRVILVNNFKMEQFCQISSNVDSSKEVLNLEKI